MNQLPGSNVFERMNLAENACFLCGHTDSITLEHVFPKWLQHRFNLWNQKLTLLNDTLIQYRQLTIPCCSTCNNVFLSNLEKPVSQAIERGYEATNSLPTLTLFQWTAKVFFGVLRKEMVLYRDQRDRNAGTIVPTQLLEAFSTLHHFLQSIIQPFEFRPNEPFSVLVANLHSESATDDYAFRDNTFYQVMQFRLGEVGLIVSLLDGGLSAKSYGRYLVKVNGRKLGRYQFDELYAKVAYQTSNFDFDPKFLTISNQDLSVPTIIEDFSGGMLNEWDQQDYSNVLRILMQQNYGEHAPEIVYQEPGLVTSWMEYLYDENGHPIERLAP